MTRTQQCLPSEIRPEPPRRLLLRGAALLAAAASIPRLAAAMPAQGAARIALHNTHTGESIDVVFRERNVYVPQALDAIDRVLRDHRTGDVARIDPGLLELLAGLSGLIDAPAPFHVISGYRSLATNARLAAASTGVARKSLHTEGRAIDIRMPGRALRDIRSAALSLNGGGVGFYPKSDFVHLDTGRVRRW